LKKIFSTLIDDYFSEVCNQVEHIPNNQQKDSSIS